VVHPPKTTGKNPTQTKTEIRLKEDLKEIDHLIKRGENLQGLINQNREVKDQTLKNWADSSKLWLSNEQVAKYENCLRQFGNEQPSCLDMMIGLLKEKKMHLNQ
jgi:hypothetical protein